MHGIQEFFKKSQNPMQLTLKDYMLCSNWVTFIRFKSEGSCTTLMLTSNIIQLAREISSISYQLICDLPLSSNTNEKSCKLDFKLVAQANIKEKDFPARITTKCPSGLTTAHKSELQKMNLELIKPFFKANNFFSLF